MSLPRPGLAAALRRHRELLAGALVAAAGLWLAARGGLFYGGLGALALAAGAGLAWTGRRRRRFAQGGQGPGVVEVVEGQIAYLGPAYGGVAALSELVELSLVELRGRRAWRLVPESGPPLFIPVEAEGVEALFDALAALPGLDGAALLAALRQPGRDERRLWRRPGGRALPGP